MLYPPYMPTKIALRVAWMLNFTDLLTLAPTTYGLTAPDAVACAAAYNTLAASYALSSNPLTRTPATVAQTQADDANAQAVIRPYAARISRNASVSALDKTAIGVTVPSTTPTPIPPPLTFPAISLASAQPLTHNLRYYDTSTPTVKAKPGGAIGIELWRAIGVVPAVDPAQAEAYGTFTKSPLVSSFLAGDVGKHCTYFARWVTRSGPGGRASVGPWSAPADFIVM